MALVIGKGKEVHLDRKSVEKKEEEYFNLKNKSPEKLFLGEEPKVNKEFNHLKVGLGWHSLNQENGICLEDIDCDASVFLLDQQGRLRRNRDVIYFNQLNSECGAVRHEGDEWAGVKGEDDEIIHVYTDKLPDWVYQVLFVVTVHEGMENGNHLGKANDVYLRMTDEDTEEEVLKYPLEKEFDGNTGVIVGRLKKDSKKEWDFESIGKGLNVKKLDDVRRLLMRERA